MSYRTYQLIKHAAQRDAYGRARQLGLDAEEAMREAHMVGAFVGDVAAELCLPSVGGVVIAIDDHHRIALVEQPSTIDPEFFAPRYFLKSSDDRAPNFAAIKFVGHDRKQALEQLTRVTDAASARLMVDMDGGA